MPTGGDECLFLGVEPKSSVRRQTDANDPKRMSLLGSAGQAPTILQFLLASFQFANGVIC